MEQPYEKAAENVAQADGQPRTGTAARACCPAVPWNVAVALPKLLKEARRRLDFAEQERPGSDTAAFYHTLVAVLAELQTSVDTASEEAPAGNP